MPQAGVADGDCPTSDACIVVSVVGPNPSTQTFTATEIRGWNDAATYPTTVRNSRGQITPSEDLEGPVFLTTLIGHVDNVALPSVKQLYFDHPQLNATTTPLDNGQLGTTGYTNDQQPVVALVNNAIAYYRPLRAGDASDDNGVVDFFQGGPGQAVHLTISTGPLLDLHASIVTNPTTAKVGQAVTFSLTYPGSPDTRGYTYAWNIEGGSGATTGATPTHTWTESGGYRVSVAITAPDGAAGSARLTPDFPVTGGPALPPPVKTTAPSAPGGVNPSPHAPHHGPDRGTGTQSVQHPTTKPHTGDHTEALSAVTGTVLVNANGVPVPITQTTQTEQPAARARATKHVGQASWGWAWSFLALAPLAAGAALELRPRKRAR